VRVLRQEIEVEEPPVVLGEAFRARLSWAGVTKVAAGAVALVGLAVWEWLR